MVFDFYNLCLIFLNLPPYLPYSYIKQDKNKGIFPFSVNKYYMHSNV